MPENTADVQSQLADQLKRVRDKYEQMGGPMAVFEMDMYEPIADEQATLERQEELHAGAHWTAWFNSHSSSATRKAFRRLKYAIRKAIRALREATLDTPEYHRAVARVNELRRRVVNVVGMAGHVYL